MRQRSWQHPDAICMCVQHQPAFYGDADDIPAKALLFGGRKFDFVPKDLRRMKPFDPPSFLTSTPGVGKSEWVKLSDLKNEQRRIEFAGCGQKVRVHE